MWLVKTTTIYCGQQYNKMRPAVCNIPPFVTVTKIVNRIKPTFSISRVVHLSLTGFLTCLPLCATYGDEPPWLLCFCRRLMTLQMSFREWLEAPDGPHRLALDLSAGDYSAVYMSDTGSVSGCGMMFVFMAVLLALLPVVCTWALLVFYVDQNFLSGLEWSLWMLGLHFIWNRSQLVQGKVCSQKRLCLMQPLPKGDLGWGLVSVARSFCYAGV